MATRLRTIVAFVWSIVLATGCMGGASGAVIYHGAIEETLPAGGTIPGSDVRYVGLTDAGAEVLIGGYRAVKKIGDSLDWSGELVDGVQVSVAQRIVAANEQRLQTVGTVSVEIDDVDPEAAQYPAGPTVEYTAPVTYTVFKGDRIPGTLITYAGKADEGAALDGISGLPHRKLGDSVHWSGRLRKNAYLDTTLRVTVYTDAFVTLVGLASIGLE